MQAGAEALLWVISIEIVRMFLQIKLFDIHGIELYIQVLICL